MSVHFLTGVPGAGKTYFAVDLLSKEYAKKSRPIFTNINLKIAYDDILQPLDVDDFHEFCATEFSFFQNYKSEQSKKRKDDPDYDEVDNYDEALKASGILDKYGSSLIVWDECHNDLDQLDPVYVRWLSYHRHFEGMDVLLITQSLDLIERKYKRFADKYFFGLNAAKRIFSTTFKYNVYTDHRQYEKFWIETISLPSKREIFSLYDSGHYKVNKSAAFKKLALPFLLLLFLAIFIKYGLFGYFLGSRHHIDENLSADIPTANDPYRVEVPQEDRSVDEMKQDALNDHNKLMPPPPLAPGGSQGAPGGNYQNGLQSALNRYFIRFQCTQSYCYFSGNRFTIPLSTLERFFEEFDGKILAAETINPDLSIITALVSSELYYMIENQNIVSRSDNYAPQSKNSLSGDSLAVPQFSTSPGV